MQFGIFHCLIYIIIYYYHTQEPRKIHSCTKGKIEPQCIHCIKATCSLVLASSSVSLNAAVALYKAIAERLNVNIYDEVNSWFMFQWYKS